MMAERSPDDRLAELAAENAALRERIGQLVDESIQIRARLAFGLTPSQAAMVDEMFNHRRVLRHHELIEATREYGLFREPDERLVKVHICHIKKRLGRDAIVNVWGVGYTLSDEMRERYKGAVEI